MPERLRLAERGSALELWRGRPGKCPAVGGYLSGPHVQSLAASRLRAAAISSLSALQRCTAAATCASASRRAAARAAATLVPSGVIAALAFLCDCDGADVCVRVAINKRNYHRGIISEPIQRD